MEYAQAFVVLGTSLCGAQAAFVLTTGQPLSAATTGSAAAAAASTAPADAETSTNPAADEPAATDDAAQHQRLRQRLAAAAAAAQARQRVSAAAAAAAQAGNPALEAAAAAEAAGVMHPPNVARLRLWDPLSGHCVPVRDPACELREVSWPCWKPCRLPREYNTAAVVSWSWDPTAALLNPRLVLRCRHVEPQQ